MRFFGVHAEVAARERDVKAERWDEVEARDRRLAERVERERRKELHG